MQKRFTILLILLVIFMLALTACTATTDNTQNSENAPPVAAQKAKEALSANLGLNASEVSISLYEERIWLDSCLGLGGIAESCMRIDTEGWLIELSAKGQTYVAHTDELGEQIRFEP